MFCRTRAAPLRIETSSSRLLRLELKYECCFVKAPRFLPALLDATAGLPSCRAGDDVVDDPSDDGVNLGIKSIRDNFPFVRGGVPVSDVLNAIILPSPWRYAFGKWTLQVGG